MNQSVSTEVADRIRSFAWRIRPSLGRDDATDAERNGGRGLGDTIAMIVAAGHRPILARGSDQPYKAFDASRHADGIARLRVALRTGTASGPANDPTSYLRIAPKVHAWVAPDGTVVAGEMESGVFQEHSLALRETGGDWSMEMRPAVPDAIRRAVASNIADRLKDLLAPVSGKISNICCPGGVLFVTDQRVDRRESIGHMGNADRIGEMALRYDPEALESEISRIVGEIRQAHAAHMVRMDAVRETCDRIEALSLDLGFHLRVDVVEEGKESWTLGATHLGSSVGGALFDRVRVRSMEDMERQLDIALGRLEANRIPHIRRLSPLGVNLAERQIDASVLLMVRDQCEDKAGMDEALKRIVAHGSRKWSARDLSDLFGRDVNATLTIDIETIGRVRAIMQLSGDISLKRGILVIRRNQLPDTILGTLAGRRVRDLVGHPWMPDALIERAMASAGQAGETYSLTLDRAYGTVDALAKAA